MKKKRSAKQLANDKRLGRMAKKRAALARKANPKRKKRRKVVKRKKNVLRARQTAMQRATNPKRKKRRKVSSPRPRSTRSHLWNVFKCRGNTVMFLAYSLGGKPAWTKDRGKAIVFKASGQAKRYAGDIAGMRGYSKYQLGVVSQTMTSAQIAAGCQKGKA